jgi:uncharacterized protein
MNVVFDTVVFVRSLINPYGRWGRAVFDRADSYTLFLSRPILSEIMDVLTRPELTRKFRGLQGMEIARIISILGQARVVDAAYARAVSRDPKDDIFLATAVAAGAEYLVSEDQDLLVLREYEGVRIVDTLTFLRILEHEPRGIEE